MIHPSALPLTAIESVNAIHFEEVEIINRLYGALADENTEATVITDILNELIEHMRMHFESENIRMQENRYTMYRLHKGEHDKILNEIRLIQMDWRTRRDRQRLSVYVSEDLPMWLNQHIKAMDIVMADALR